MRTPLIFDSAQKITQRKKTKDGFLIVPGMIAASDNVQPYLAKELGLDSKMGMKPGKVIRVYRPKSEVDKAVETFDGLPITLEHPKTMVNNKTWRVVARGETRKTVAVDAGLQSELVIRDEQTVDEVERGIRTELSAGYDFHIEMKSGVSPKGEAYDAIASDFTGNHIAVTKQARGGHACRVADAQNKERSMRTLVFDAALLGTAAPTQLPEMEDNVAQAVDSLIRNIVAAKDSVITEKDDIITHLSEEKDQLVASHSAEMTKVTDSLPALIMAEASDRASVISGAEKLGITLLKIEAKDTAALRRDILVEASKDAGRKSVIDAMTPDITEATPEALKMATSALFALPGMKTIKSSGHDSLSKALRGGGVKTEETESKKTTPAIGRDSALSASANAWRRDKK